jgi:hypothetical protein
VKRGGETELRFTFAVVAVARTTSVRWWDTFSVMSLRDIPEGGVFSVICPLRISDLGARFSFSSNNNNQSSRNCYYYSETPQYIYFAK